MVKKMFIYYLRMLSSIGSCHTVSSPQLRHWFLVFDVASYSAYPVLSDYLSMLSFDQ